MGFNHHRIKLAIKFSVQILHANHHVQLCGFVSIGVCAVHLTESWPVCWDLLLQCVTCWAQLWCTCSCKSRLRCCLRMSARCSLMWLYVLPCIVFPCYAIYYFFSSTSSMHCGISYPCGISQGILFAPCSATYYSLKRQGNIFHLRMGPNANVDIHYR